MAAANVVAAQVQFIEVGQAKGLKPYVMQYGLGSGVAAADFDDDGDIDLFVPNDVSAPNQLFRNAGDHFEEIASAAGLDALDYSRAALWIDFDGDHRLDLIVAGDCFFVDSGHEETCLDSQTLKLYRQVADAKFEDVTTAAGFVDDLVFGPGDHRSGMSAGDIDNDGDLDIYLTFWGGPARLFENLGDGTFQEISTASGTEVWDFYHQPMMHDWNGDGWLDIYSAVDFAPNRLWINQGDNTFVDVAATTGTDSAWNDMGLSLADVDNDGDLDIYITNVETLVRHNLVLRNDSSGSDLQFTPLSNTGAEAGGWGWGVTFADVDKDGYGDLAATNGRITNVEIADQSRLFLNSSVVPGTFTDISVDAGFDDTLLGSSLIAADLDRDGDLDLVQTCRELEPVASALRLLQNQPQGPAIDHGYLVVQPRMRGPNHRAIGAVVRIETGASHQMRLISAGTSYLGQEPAEAFFGTGAAKTVDRVTVEWPGGGQTTLENVAANQVLRMEPAEVFADGFESGDTSAW
ncbi:MAG: CRTAC1 family protein [Acidobacteriota bacterium]